jgi:hypothetical protein
MWFGTFLPTKQGSIFFLELTSGLGHNVAR